MYKNMKPVPKRNDAARLKGRLPTILSCNRYMGIVGRAKNLAAKYEEEENRQRDLYNEYLFNGHNALLRLFTGEVIPTKEENLAKVKRRRDEALLKKSEAPRVAIEMDAEQQERIRQVCLILDRLKAGPRMIDQAMLESEMLRQRELQEAINEKIKEDKRTQYIWDRDHPKEIKIIPQAEDVNEKAKKRRMKDVELQKDLIRDIECRRRRRQSQADQKIIDGIVDRDHIQCMLAKDEKERQERFARRCVEAKRNYREAIKVKQLLRKRKSTKECFNERIRCVYNTAELELKKRVALRIATLRAKQIAEHYRRGMEVHRVQEMAAKKAADKLEEECNVYGEEIMIDTMRRECEINHKEARRKADIASAMLQKKQKDAEVIDIQRFLMALRFKNAEVNKDFEKASANKKQATREEIGQIRKQELFEFRNRRRRKKLEGTTDMFDNTYLLDDKAFFAYALNRIRELKAEGRPLMPAFRAVNEFKRRIDFERNVSDIQRPVVVRNRMWDTAQPGYLDKAKHAWALRDAKQKFDASNNKDLFKTLNNCLKITNMEINETSNEPPTVCHDPRSTLVERIKKASRLSPGLRVLTPTNFQAVETGATEISDRDSSICEVVAANAKDCPEPIVRKSKYKSIKPRSSRPTQKPKSKLLILPEPNYIDANYVSDYTAEDVGRPTVTQIDFTTDNYLTPKIGSRYASSIDSTPLFTGHVKRRSNVSQIQFGYKVERRSDMD